MSQAQCTAEGEAWLVRNNFTAPQRAHLLQQVDALSDFSEAVDEDIPAITEGWSSLARSKLRRCVAALCRARGWECKLAAAAPLGLGTCVGAFAGGRLASGLDEEPMRLGFGALMVALGAKTLLKKP